MLPTRMEICSLDFRFQSDTSIDQLMKNINDEIFTRFVFKLVFRVSGRSVP